jgi:hypothetical protein
MVKTKHGQSAVKVNCSILGEIRLIDPVSFAGFENSIDNLVRQYSTALGDRKAREYIGCILNSVEDLACNEDRDVKKNVSHTIEYLASAYRIVDCAAKNRKIRNSRLLAKLVLAQMQDQLNYKLIPGYEQLIDSGSILPL